MGDFKQLQKRGHNMKIDKVEISGMVVLFIGVILLIVACIRILYLGIMGWIGSILTIRGIQLLKMERQAPSEPKQKANPTTGHVNAEKKEITT